ncbi:MAG: hypothetical protein RIS43_230 [Actinomycetota bacterium]
MNPPRPSGLPDEPVWVFGVDDDDDDTATTELGREEFRKAAPKPVVPITQETVTPTPVTSHVTPEPEIVAAADAFKNETAGEAAQVFEEVGETAGEASAAFDRSLTDRLVDVAGPAIATVISKVGPVVANAAVSLAPVVAKAEAAAKPVLSKAEELLQPVIKQAEPWVNKAGDKFNEVADVVADRADDAAAAFDSATDRIKDTAAGLVGVAKPVAEEVVTRVKNTVNDLVNRK